MFTCYEEGAAVLPAPVSQLRAVRVEDSGVLLRWTGAGTNTSNTDHYEVFYKQVTRQQHNLGRMSRFIITIEKVKRVR